MLIEYNTVWCFVNERQFMTQLFFYRIIVFNVEGNDLKLGIKNSLFYVII